LTLSEQQQHFVWDTASAQNDKVC